MTGFLILGLLRTHRSINVGVYFGVRSMSLWCLSIFSNSSVTHAEDLYVILFYPTLKWALSVLFYSPECIKCIQLNASKVQKKYMVVIHCIILGLDVSRPPFVASQIAIRHKKFGEISHLSKKPHLKTNSVEEYVCSCTPLFIDA